LPNEATWSSVLPFVGQVQGRPDRTWGDAIHVTAFVLDRPLCFVGVDPFLRQTGDRHVSALPRVQQRHGAPDA
jgi:hypothetical protein